MVIPLLYTNYNIMREHIFKVEYEGKIVTYFDTIASAEKRCHKILGGLTDLTLDYATRVHTFKGRYGDATVTAITLKGHSFRRCLKLIHYVAHSVSMEAQSSVRSNVYQSTVDQYLRVMGYTIVSQYQKFYFGSNLLGFLHTNPNIGSHRNCHYKSKALLRVGRAMRSKGTPLCLFELPLLDKGHVAIHEVDPELPMNPRLLNKTKSKMLLQIRGLSETISSSRTEMQALSDKITKIDRQLSEFKNI